MRFRSSEESLISSMACKGDKAVSVARNKAGKCEDVISGSEVTRGVTGICLWVNAVEEDVGRAEVFNGFQ
jgi:hypothetical protein